MIEVILAASEVQTVCQKYGWPFCFIGGLALQRWGAPRMTVDVDLTLLTGYVYLFKLITKKSGVWR
ncbi:MAG: hypothetical protein HYU36_10760 [Planctomycetes bacterium]|nr:hypothetical protein [Planctomycetota bacterium]